MRNSLKINRFLIRKNRPFILLFTGALAICTILFLYFNKPSGYSYGYKRVSFRIKYRNLTMINMREIRAYVIIPNIEDTDQVNDSIAIVIINSHVCNRERRKLYREAISDAEVKKLGMRRIFLLGTILRNPRHLCNITQKEIEEEHRLHGDLLQGSMEDIHANVEVKDLMGLDFATHFARQFTFIVHMNDNVLIDVYGMQKFLWHFGRANGDRIVAPDFLMGFLQPEDPVDEYTEESEKNETDEKLNNFDDSYYEYPDLKPVGFPKYLDSYFYVTNYHTAETLVWQAQALPPYLETSIWITGMLRDSLNIPVMSLPDQMDGSFEDIEKCLRLFRQDHMNCPHVVHCCGSRKELDTLLEFQRNGKECFEGHCKPDNWQERIRKRIKDWLRGIE